MQRNQNILSSVIAITALWGLSACDVQSDTENSEAGDNAVAEAQTSEGGVVRSEAEPEPAEVAAAPTMAPLATQPGPDGTTVTLQKAQVAGDVLSVQIGLSKANGSVYINLDDTSVVDDATAKRMAILKDDRGSWMASPKDSGKGERLFVSFRTGDAIAWFKFPAPAPASETVSINIDSVGTFDGIKVQR